MDKINTKEDYRSFINNFIEGEKFLLKQGEKILSYIQNNHVDFFLNEILVATFELGFIKIFYKEVHPDLLVAKINIIDGVITGVYSDDQSIKEFISTINQTNNRLKEKERKINKKIQLYDFISRGTSYKLLLLKKQLEGIKVFQLNSDQFINFLNNRNKFTVDITDDLLGLLTSSIEFKYIDFSKTFETATTMDEEVVA